jgi:hypothetical protein
MLPALFDEGDRFLGVARREGRLVDRIGLLDLTVAPEGKRHHVVAVEQSEPAVEAEVAGQRRRVIAQVPLSHKGSCVAAGPEGLGECDLIGRQPHGTPREPQQPVERRSRREHHARQPGADRPAPREQAGARRAALDPRRVVVVEGDALPRQGVESRSSEGAAPVGAEVTEAQVVEEDDDEVGALGLAPRPARHAFELTGLASQPFGLLALLVGRDPPRDPRSAQQGHDQRHDDGAADPTSHAAAILSGKALGDPPLLPWRKG